MCPFWSPISDSVNKLMKSSLGPVESTNVVHNTPQKHCLLK